MLVAEKGASGAFKIICKRCLTLLNAQDMLIPDAAHTKGDAMKTYTVTLENYEGKCKEVKVDASSEHEAMAMAQKNGWYLVDVK